MPAVTAFNVHIMCSSLSHGLKRDNPFVGLPHWRSSNDQPLSSLNIYMANDLPIPPPLISVPRIQTLIASLLVSIGSGTNYVGNMFSLMTCGYESKEKFTRSIQVRNNRCYFLSWVPLPKMKREIFMVEQFVWQSLCTAYSPQLGARLKISHTQLNIVGLAGNSEIYSNSNHFTNLSERSSVGVYSTGPIWGRIVDSHGPRILLASSFVFLLGGYSGIRYFYVSGLAPDALTVPILSFSALVLCSFLTGAGGNGGFMSAVNSTAKTFPDRAVCIHRWFSKVYFPHYHPLHVSEHPQLGW